MIPRLNSLWIGEQLGYIEKLTLASALSVGHPITVYSYTPEKLRGVPNGVEVRDANQVAPYQALAHYFEGGSAALGTDFFRYAMQAKGLGYWVDLDLYLSGPSILTRNMSLGGSTTVDKRRGSAASCKLRHGSRAVHDPKSELAAALLRATKDGDLLLEKADRRRHPAENYR